MSTPGDVAKVEVDGAVGEKAGEVLISIDYAIIQHFSEHLYGSPNKAVEELVTNGYDALATDVRVYVPGEQVVDRIVIWDDGESMDAEALKRLWWIAKSPKADGSARVAASSTVPARKLIGKFGIGKLASYSVGRRITHLCKTDDGYLLVHIDYRDLGLDESEDDTDAPEGPDTSDDETGQAGDADKEIPDEPVEPSPDGPAEQSPQLPAQENSDRPGEEPHRSPIVRLEEEAARAWMLSQFREGLPTETLDAMWEQESWTLAVVSDLKDVELPPGRLGWVLSTGMPLRDDFRVYVNDVEVKSRLAGHQAAEWDLSQKELADGLKSAWTEARNSLKVTGDLKQEAGHGGVGLAKTVELPELGEVRATVRFFSESLNRGKAAEHGRSYGFFVYVRGRLLNPDDAFLLLPDPSFGTFYRGQWVIHADELDDDLLADREHLRRDTPRSRELAILQQALYLAARSQFDRLDTKAQHERSTASLLPVDSRESFREPFTALLLRNDQDDAGFDLADPKVERKLRSPDDPIAVLDTEVGGFSVNAAHPLFRTIRERLGGGKVAKEALRAIDLFAVSERLLEGHLFDIGLDENRVDAVLGWRDDLFRAIADRYKGAPDEIVAKVHQTSYGGKAPFEVALAELFELMGFVATRDGASGQKDILVVAPIGQDETRFTIEGKGSAKAVTNDGAEISIAASHRDKVGAKHAIVVAREFTGFKQDGEPEILRQCRSTKDVSIVTVDLLADLYGAVHRYFYPLDMILPVLAAIESPADKAKRIHALQNPVAGFDHRQLLDIAWQEQQAAAAGDVVVFRSVWQQHYKAAMSFDDFRVKLTALEALSRGLIRLTGDDRSYGTLRQAPEIIAAAIGASLKAHDE